MAKRMTTFVGVAVLAASISGAAHATVIFTPGNNPQPGEENILFATQQTGTTITGVTNQSNTSVQFTSTQTVSTGGIGQAFLQAVAPETTITGAITFSIPGRSFTDFIFNPAVTGPNATGGPATVTAIANDGSFTDPITLGNGNNFLTITTSGGESLTSVTISPAAGSNYGQYQQPRVSGISGVTPPPALPEPASLVLLGSALAGLGLFARQRRQS